MRSSSGWRTALRFLVNMMRENGGLVRCSKTYLWQFMLESHVCEESKWDNSSLDCNVKIYCGLANYQQVSLKCCIKLLHSRKWTSFIITLLICKLAVNINLNMKTWEGEYLEMDIPDPFLVYQIYHSCCLTSGFDVQWQDYLRINDQPWYG